MTDMIEKVARALFAVEWKGLACESEFASSKDYWITSARAALEALRTPTNEMIEAGVNRGRRDDLYTDVEHCFQLMVDKALGRVDLPVGEEQQP